MSTSFPGKLPGAGTMSELPSESWRTTGREGERTVGGSQTIGTAQLQALTAKPKGGQGYQAKPGTSS